MSCQNFCAPCVRLTTSGSTPTPKVSVPPGVAGCRQLGARDLPTRARKPAPSIGPPQHLYGHSGSMRGQLPRTPLSPPPSGTSRDRAVRSEHRSQEDTFVHDFEVLQLMAPFCKPFRVAVKLLVPTQGGASLTLGCWVVHLRRTGADDRLHPSDSRAKRPTTVWPDPLWSRAAMP